MIRKLVQNFKPFIKYCLVGGLGTLIDVASLYVFIEYFSFALIPATTLAFLLAATNNFILNKFWTFRNESRNYRKLYIKFLIVSVVGLTLTNISMYILVRLVGIWYVLAKLLTSAMVLVWNFLGNKYWTFRLTERLIDRMTHFDYDVSIIIPAFNEENRIKNTLLAIHDYLCDSSFTAEIIVVNDGSSDRTVDIVERKIASISNLKIVELKKNAGKGAAIRKGVEVSRGRYVLFTDADNSTPIEELGGFLDMIKSEQADIVIGSRYLDTSQVKIKQSLLRVLISRLGNGIIRLFLINEISDTQCGFKLFRHNAAKEIFSRQKVRRWGFDMEALAIAKMLEYKIIEVPVSWFNSSESRLRPIRASFRTLTELAYIKLNQWSGRYR